MTLNLADCDITVLANVANVKVSHTVLLNWEQFALQSNRTLGALCSIEPPGTFTSDQTGFNNPHEFFPHFTPHFLS